MKDNTLGIIVDSFSALTDVEAKELNFEVLHLRYSLDGVENEDFIGEMDEQVKIDFLNAKEIRTSLPPLNEIQEAVKKMAEKHQDVLVLITPTGLSSTYSAVSSVTNEYPNVHIVDHNFSGWSLVNNALEARNKYAKGISINDISQTIEQRANKTNTFLILESLNFIAKGGRLQFIPKPLLKMLKVFPIIHYYKKNKLSGFKRRASAAAELVFNKMSDIIEGIQNFKNYELHLVHYFDGEILKALIDIFKVNGIKFDTSVWGSNIVMAHAGPYGVGLTLTPKTNINV